MYYSSVIHMPDLVQNHSVAASISSSHQITAMQQHLHGRNNLQISTSDVDRPTYRGHQVDNLIRPSPEHYSDILHHQRVDMSNQHESNDMLHLATGKLTHHMCEGMRLLPNFFWALARIFQ